MTATCRDAGPHPSPLTTRQREAFDAIVRYYEALGEGAPVGYVARQLQVSHVRAHQHIDALVLKGWVIARGSPATPRPFRP